MVVGRRGGKICAHFSLCAVCFAGAVLSKIAAGVVSGQRDVASLPLRESSRSPRWKLCSCRSTRCGLAANLSSVFCARHLFFSTTTSTHKKQGGCYFSVSLFRTLLRRGCVYVGARGRGRTGLRSFYGFGNSSSHGFKFSLLRSLWNNFQREGALKLIIYVDIVSII